VCLVGGAFGARASLPPVGSRYIGESSLSRTRQLADAAIIELEKRLQNQF
jgi:Leu/Phe-tRNA-protein transferase